MKLRYILIVVAAFLIAVEFGLLKLFIEKHGTVHQINENTQHIDVDISHWAERVREKRGMDEEMAGASFKVTEELKLVYENGTPAEFKDIYLEQEVQLVENDAGEVTKVILLEVEPYGTVTVIDAGKAVFQVDLSIWAEEVNELEEMAEAEDTLLVEHADQLKYSYENGIQAKFSDMSAGQEVRLVKNDMNRIVEVFIIREN